MRSDTTVICHSHTCSTPVSEVMMLLRASAKPTSSMADIAVKERKYMMQMLPPVVVGS